MYILNGKTLSNKFKDNIKNEIEENNYNICLAIIMVGTKIESKTYVNMKINACNYVGIKNIDILLESNTNEKELLNVLNNLNNDNNIHGILVQLPLPSHLNEKLILDNININKDVDGFHAQNFGNLALNNYKNCNIPCTPAGVMELFKEYNINLKGKHVVVVGKSNIVGLPMILLCLHNEATVSVCHIHTQNTKEITKTADILISACGVPHLFNKDDVKKDAIIIDIGINKIDDSTKKSGFRLVGDVNYDDVKDKVSAITPVPGGVGPMTIAMLLQHTLNSYKRLNKIID